MIENKTFFTLKEEYIQTVFYLPSARDILPKNFVIVTAANPMDQKLTTDVNHSRHKQLAQKIKHLAHFELTGSSPNQSHQEIGFGIECDLQDGINLGIFFQQRAIFMVEEDILFLIDCQTKEQKKIGRFSDRLRN